MTVKKKKGQRTKAEVTRAKRSAAMRAVWKRRRADAKAAERKAEAKRARRAAAARASWKRRRAEEKAARLKAEASRAKRSAAMRAVWERRRAAEAEETQRLEAEQKARRAERRKKRPTAKPAPATDAQRYQRLSDGLLTDAGRAGVRQHLIGQEFNPFYVGHILRSRMYRPWVRHLIPFAVYKRVKPKSPVRICSKYDPRRCYDHWTVWNWEKGQILELLRYMQSKRYIVKFLHALDFKYFEIDDDEPAEPVIYNTPDGTVSLQASRTPYGFINTEQYDLRGLSQQELIAFTDKLDILEIIVTLNP